jgi:hypothetical protein
MASFVESKDLKEGLRVRYHPLVEEKQDTKLTTGTIVQIQAEQEGQVYIIENDHSGQQSSHRFQDIVEIVWPL